MPSGQRAPIPLIGRLQPALAPLLQGVGCVRVPLFLDRAQHCVKRRDSWLDHVQAVDDVHRIAQDLFEHSEERFGPIHHHFDAEAFLVETAPAPRHDLVRASALQRHNGLAFFHIDEERMVVVPLASGVCINTNGPPACAGAFAIASMVFTWVRSLSRPFQ